MDPVANMREQLELARSIADDLNRVGAAYRGVARQNRLAELVIALHEWREMGGFINNSERER